MPNSILLSLAATVSLSFGMIYAASAPAGAAPRITVGQCINSWQSCMNGCPGYIDGPLPPSGNPAADKYCQNRCDANHAACVDRAMDFSRRAAKRARKRL